MLNAIYGFNVMLNLFIARHYLSLKNIDQILVMFVSLRKEGMGFYLSCFSHVGKFISWEDKVITFLQNPLFVGFFKRGREEI